MSRLAALALCLAISGVACYRAPPSRSGPSGADDRSGRAGGDPSATYEPPPVSEADRIETERLRNLGPVHTPYEQGPRLIWDDAAQRAVVDVLAPVVESRRLPIRTRALVWVLVGVDGTSVDAVVQTSSASEPFDRAAIELAKRLRFIPAAVDGKRVPVWVIREISLLMQ